MFLDGKTTITHIEVFKPDFVKKKAVYVPGRNHHSLTFRISGRVTVDDGEISLVSRAGDLTFVPRGKSYYSEIRESGSMYAVHFVTSEGYENARCEVFSPQNPVVFNNMFSDLTARFKPGRENDLYCMSIFYGILAEWRHEYIRSSEGYYLPVNSRMRRAKSAIDRGFADSSLSVAGLAAESGVSEAYFRREFGRCFGMSPAAYIKKTRIENAKAMLRTGYYSVTDTAVRCGFDSISYFSYEFHRIAGCTPREYALKEQD